MLCLQHYPDSKKMKSHESGGHFLNQRQLCWNQKKHNGLELGDVRVWVEANHFLWMSADPRIKGLEWTNSLYWNLTSLTVCGSLKWAFLLPGEDHEVHRAGSWACRQASQGTSNGRRRHEAGAREPPTSKQLSLGDPGQFTRPLVSPLWQRQGNNSPSRVALRS